MASPRPHVLFLTADQLRADAIGTHRAHATGAASAAVASETPHIDRLAERGVRFDNAYAAAPQCVPARATWLTGRHPPEHGALHNGMARRPLRAPSLYRSAADAGYLVGVLGKTHYYPPLTEADRVHVMWHYASTNATRGSDRWRAPNRTADTTLEGLLVAAFAGFLSYRARTAPLHPWFVHLSFVNPHPPLDAGSTDCGRLPIEHRRVDAARVSPALVLQHELSGASAVRSNLTLYLSRWRQRRRCYGGAVEYVDAMVGRALALVDLTSTLVLFTSDHGDMLGARGIGQKQAFYEAAWRVPLIVAGPGVPRDGADDGFACGVDVSATLRAAMGARDRAAPGADLRSGAARTGCPGWMGANLRAYVNATEKRVYENGRLVLRFARPGDPDELENLALRSAL